MLSEDGFHSLEGSFDGGQREKACVVNKTEQAPSVAVERHWALAHGPSSIRRRSLSTVPQAQ